MKLLVVSLVYVVSLALVAVLAFAGPHAGLLPHWLEGVVLAAGWLAVLLAPILAARMAWLRMSKRSD